MDWWAWLLLVWAVVAVCGGILLGMAIRTAELRDLGHDRQDQTPADEDAA
jgi:hypothetical protein